MIYVCRTSSIIENKNFLVINSVKDEHVKIIKNINELSIILRLTYKPINFSNFCIQLNKIQDSNFSEKEIFNTLLNLKDKGILELGVLKTERNNLNFEILKYYIDNFSISIELERGLKDILTRIDYLNQQGFNQKKFNSLIKKMKNIVESKCYITSISFLQKKIAANSIDIAKEYAQSVINYFMPLLYYVPNNRFLEEAEDKFIENYGENTYIPLKELIINNFFETNNDYKFKAYMRVVAECFEKIVSYCRVRDGKIDLLRSDFIQMCITELKKKGYIENKQIILNEEILFDSVIVEDEIKLLNLSPQIGSNSAGKLLGRYLNNYLSEVFSAKAKAFYERKLELASSKKVEFVEISSYHIDKILSNVISRYQSEHKYEIVLDAMPSKVDKILDINNLWIYLENGKITLTNKTISEKYLIDNSHAINYELYPEVYRLLEKISYNPTVVDILHELRRIRDKLIPDMDIYFGDIILFPKKIKLFYNKNYDKFNTSDFFSKLSSLLEKENLMFNNFTYLSIENSDNGFLVDMNNIIHQKIILNEIKKNISVYFSYPRFMEYKLLKSDTIKSEYVYSVYDVSNYKFNTPTIFNDIKAESIFNKSLIYIKIYISRKYELHVLKDIYYKLLNYKIKNIIYGFHFVRYKEGLRNHIRLRIFTNNLFETIIFDKIVCLIEQIEDNEFVEDIAVHKFKREINRYGSNSYYFYEDLAIKESFLLLDLMFTHQIDRKYIIYKLGLDIISKFDVSREFNDNYKYSNDTSLSTEKSKFQKEKKLISQKIDDISFDENLLYQEWVDKLCAFTSSVNKKNKYEIFRSVLHLLCNRVIGIDRKKEEIYMICLNVLYLYRKHK